ncbi:hypothetical protein EJ06DRAFT_524874 [Trichodelitschia bisporula]|uniref:Uncharacterized protein n=1 Tax=Trichodelitschia bisporula TaxID=703511 RepID=A0A6G1HJV9_9PEZI|nr:hypothetical protein EJ06DRAFT_524874 [Trichodelitschia bisporula]
MCGRLKGGGLSVLPGGWCASSENGGSTNGLSIDLHAFETLPGLTLTSRCEQGKSYGKIQRNFSTRMGSLLIFLVLRLFTYLQHALVVLHTYDGDAPITPLGTMQRIWRL